MVEYHTKRVITKGAAMSEQVDFETKYARRLKLNAMLYLASGLSLLGMGMFWWAIPALVAAYTFWTKAKRDKELFDDFMPSEFYDKDYQELVSHTWIHVLLVIGAFYIPALMSKARRMRGLADAIVGSRKWFNHLTIYFALKENCGVSDEEALLFAVGYARLKADSDEWFAFSSDRLAKDCLILIRTEVVEEARKKVHDILKAKRAVPADSLYDVVMEVTTIGKNEAKFFVLDGGGDWLVVEVGDSKYVFDDSAIDDCRRVLEDAVSKVDRAKFNDLKKALSRFFSLPDEILAAMIEKVDGEFQNLPFDDGRFYVSNRKNNRIVICPCCGIARLVDEGKTNDYKESYCSDYCRETDASIRKQGEKLRLSKLAAAGIDAAAFGGVVNRIGRSWDWNKGRVASMSGKAHGLAAEDANTMIDKLTGHDASVVGNDNALNGPDRVVDGELIQSKYCATAHASVSEAFGGPSGEYRYIDGSGRPMQLEVPKDQYLQAVEEMRKKISEGKVPGVTDPDEATKLVRKGHLTYQQAQNLCKFGTIESLAFDAFTGVIVGATAGGISFVLTAAIGYWQGRDIKKALRGAVLVGLKTGGKTFAAYVITAQVQRIPAVKTFLDSAININFGAHGKAVKSLGDGLSKMAGASKFKNAVANSAVRGAVVTAAATFVVTSAWEIGSYCRGKISGMQCFKNVLVGGAGIAGGSGAALLGAGWGTAICPGVGTVVGGLVGGLVGGSLSTWLAKFGLDKLIDDDAVVVFALVQEQAGIIATMFCMGKGEIDKVMEKIGSYISGREKFVSEVYSYSRKGLGRQYVTRIFKPMFVDVALERPLLLAQDVSPAAIGNALQ